MNFNPMQFMNQLNQLKSKGGDPNQMIQQMLNSGRVSQTQYDNAVKMAQQIQQMLAPGGHR
jgi:hypothetical protein